MGPPGNWTRPDSWPGQQLPRSIELEVVVPPFYHIVYNNFTAIGAVGDLKIFGKLSMSEDEGLKLLVKSIQVFSGGVMQVGTSFAPHRNVQACENTAGFGGIRFAACVHLYGHRLGPESLWSLRGQREPSRKVLLA